MLLKSIKLTNFLSFGEASEPVEMRPLNVLIGANGSGKSNFIEALELLRAAPRDLSQPLRDGGGVCDWLWKGEAASPPPVAEIDAVVDYPDGALPLRYLLQFTQVDGQFRVVDERVEDMDPHQVTGEPRFHYRYQKGRPVINASDAEAGSGGQALAVREPASAPYPRSLPPGQVAADASILSQCRDLGHCPALAYLRDAFAGIRIYRDWSFGRQAVPRRPQRADLPDSHLAPDAGNLGLALARIKQDPASKQRLLEALQAIYAGAEDFEVRVEGGTAQIFLIDRHGAIPAARLAAGALRYLCLLAILCHPAPGPLVCIEEPELGLHPDLTLILAELVREASERTQLILTTHSEAFVDTFHYTPEVVLVTENREDGTRLERLDAENLQSWLEKYRLGDLWSRGYLGGNRW